MGFHCGQCGETDDIGGYECAYETNWTREAAIEALSKNRIIDEVEDDLPPCLVDWLREKGSVGDDHIASHVRYEGDREIWWFDSWYVNGAYSMPNWPKVAIEDREADARPGGARPAAPVAGGVGDRGKQEAA